MFQGAVKTVVLRHAVASTAGGTSVAAPKRVIGACLKKGRTPFSLLSSRLSSRGVRPGCRRTFSSDATTKKGVLTQEQQRTAAIVGGTVALALIGYSFGKSAGKRRGGSTQELPTAALLPKLAQIAESSSDKEELARLENNSLEVFLAVKVCSPPRSLFISPQISSFCAFSLQSSFSHRFCSFVDRVRVLISTFTYILTSSISTVSPSPLRYIPSPTFAHCRVP